MSEPDDKPNSRPYWLLWITAGLAWLIITAAMYGIAQTNAAWLPAIALGYMVPTGLITFFVGAAPGGSTALLSLLAVLPLIGQYWHRPTIAIAIGTVMLVTWIQAGLWGMSSHAHRLQKKRYEQSHQSLNRRLQELSAIEEIDHALGATLDPQQVLDMVLDHAVRSLNVTVGVIGTLSADEKQLIIRATSGLTAGQKDKLLARPWSVSQGIAGRVIQSGQFALVQDVHQDADYITVVPEIHSELAVPLYAKERVIGVLNLESTQRDVFDEHAVRFVQHLSEHAAVALEKAELYAISEQRAQEAQELYHIATLSSSSLELGRLLQEIVPRTATFLQAEKCLLLVVDPDDQYLTPHPSGMYGGYIEAGQIRIALNDDLKAGLLYRGRPFISNHTADDSYIPAVYRPLIDQFGVHTLLSAPLRLGDRYIGEIHLCNKQGGPFTRNDARILGTIASHLSAAIANAQIYEFTDRQLRRRLEELTALQRISSQLNATLNLGQILDVVIGEAWGITQATHGYIALSQDKETAFLPIAGRGYTEAEFARLQQAWKTGISALSSQVLKNRKTIISSTPSDEQSLCPIRNARSALVTPIFYDDQVAGLIHLFAAEPDLFASEHQSFVESLASQASLAIRNARLYEAEVQQRQLQARRAAQIARLASIGNAFRLQKPLDQVLQLTAEAICEGVGFKAVLISLAEGEPPLLRRMAAVGLPDEVFSEMRQIRQPLAVVRQIMREEFRIAQSFYIPHDRKAIWQNALHTYTFDQPRPTSHWHPDDLLIVPMYGIGQRIVGLITVDQPVDGLVPDVSVIEMLQIFAQQAAIAIENNLLYSDLQRRVDSLTLINQVGQIITSGLDLDNMLREIVSTSAQLLQSDYGVLFFWNRQIEELQAQVAFGFALDDQTLSSTRTRQALAEIAIRKGSSIIVSDVGNDPRFNELVQPPLGLRSMLMVPLIEGTAAAGALLIGARQAGNFNRTDQVILSTLADQAAVAIQNARLYASSVQRANELETLNDIAQTIVTSLDMDTTLSMIMARVGEALHAESGSLLLIEDRQLSFRISFGPASEQVKGLKLAWGQGIAGWVAQTGQSLLVPDVSQDKRHFAQIDQTTAYQTRSVLCVPLKGHGNQIIGVLEVINSLDGRAFSSQDQRLLESIATSAVIAIENANLFAQRERKIVELGTLNEIGQALSSTLDQDDLMELIYHQVNQVMDARNFFVALYEPEEDKVWFPIAYERNQRVVGPDIETVPPDWQPRIGRRGLTEHIIHTGRVLWLPNRFQERLAEMGIEQIGSQALSWLGVPILFGQQVLGVIAVQSYEQENTYDEDHRDLLRTIAGHASVAIRNARLFNQITQMSENLERLVQERTEELAMANRDLRIERDRLNTLYHIARELASSLESDLMFSRAMALLCNALGAELGYILLKDSENESLTYKAIQNTLPYVAPFAQVGQQVNETSEYRLIEWVMGHRESICISHISQDSRLEFAACQDIPCQSLLATQLISGEDIVGAVVLYHSQANFFTIDHQRMLDAIASQVAIMVSNAEMLRLLREATNRLGKMLLAQQQESARSQAILEGIADGVMVMDAKGKLTLFNAAAERILQMTRDEVIGRTAAEMSGFFNLTGSSWTELTERWARSETNAVQQAVHEAQVQVERQVLHLRIAPIFRMGSFEGSVSVLRDITKDVEVDRLKSEFVSTVSHELRTPMTSIKGYIDLLHNGMAGPVSDAQKRFLEIIKNNADRLTVLVNDLLDISHIDTGRVKLSIEAVQIEAIINRVITDLKPNAAKKSITLNGQAPQSLPLVRADAARVTQILTNLTQNAINYTPAEGQVEVSAELVDNMLVAHVADNGIGISEEDQAKLFTRFFRADNALVMASSGTGLGLSIARSLIELHGGHIWFESQVGQGTTFSFSLPLAEQGAIAAAQREFKTISYRAQDRHILVIEDEVEVANQISHHLRSQRGYRTHIVRTGQDALDLLQNHRHPVHLITLDLRLPDMDGLHILRQIKQTPDLASIPVVIISIAHREYESKQLGAQAYLSKPVEEKQLVSTIERLLA